MVGINVGIAGTGNGKEFWFYSITSLLVNLR